MVCKCCGRRMPDRIDKIRSTLSKKAEEYATEGNRYHNFDDMAKLIGVTPEQALIGLMAKHWVSVRDMLIMVEYLDHPPVCGYDPMFFTITPPLIDEKFGDLINYLILLTGIRNRDITFQKVVNECIVFVDACHVAPRADVKVLDEFIQDAISDKLDATFRAIAYLIALEQRMLERG